MNPIKRVWKKCESSFSPCKNSIYELICSSFKRERSISPSFASFRSSSLFSSFLAFLFLFLFLCFFLFFCFCCCLLSSQMLLMLREQVTMSLLGLNFFATRIQSTVLSSLSSPFLLDRLFIPPNRTAIKLKKLMLSPAMEKLGLVRVRVSVRVSQSINK